MESVNAKTALTLWCLGLVIIGVSVPLYLGKIKPNRVYGFRIRKAFASEENWYLINRFGAVALMGWSAVIMAVGLACLWIEPAYVLPVANATFLSLLVPIALTVLYARRL